MKDLLFERGANLLSAVKMAAGDTKKRNWLHKIIIAFCHREEVFRRGDPGMDCHSTSCFAMMIEC